MRLTPPDGTTLTVGEAPTTAEGEMPPAHRIGADRYEARWTVTMGGETWAVLGRMDAGGVADALQGFVRRIVGLVLLIAVVVTAATMMVLSRTVLRPILELQRAMCATAMNPGQADHFRVTPAGDHELGEMAAAFNDMAGRITASIRDLEQHQRDLQAARLAAERASAAKSDFLASMSHELRTPLNAVIGFSEMIETELWGPLGSPKYAEYARDIRDSGTHLLTLVNDILDLSKAESGKLVLQEEPLALADLGEACLRMVSDRARRHGVVLAGELPPLTVLADGNRLRQVLLNLLTNAIKFTPEGGRVTLSGARGEAGELLLSVADTGVGIAPEDLPKVFEPFGQANNQTARSASQGTGLGVPISKRLIEAHGGRLDIDSEVGRGTEVILRLPAGRVQEAGMVPA